MGDSSPPPVHQATLADGFAPAARATEIMPVFFVPIGQNIVVLAEFMTTCTPVLDVYAARAARADAGIVSGAMSILASWPSMPPRLVGSSKKNRPFFVTAAITVWAPSVTATGLLEPKSASESSMSRQIPG